MGICESKKNYAESNKTKENFPPIESYHAINESMKLNETNLKTNRIKECIIESASPFEKVDRMVSNVSKSICKIKIETSIGTIKGTGFLLAFYIEQERF